MSAAKPATATPAIEPSIKVPKVGGKGGKIINVLNNSTTQVTGEAVSDTLETLDKVSEYNFSSLTTMRKIAGFTASLQIIIFVLSNIFVLGNTLLRKKNNFPLPSSSSPPSPPQPSSKQVRFQSLNDLKTKLSIHLSTVRKIDAQFYQILGILSQLLIIIAASVVADDKLSVIDPLQRQEQTSTQNEKILAVRHAALFSKTITIIAILAIIMTFMNIITWMADIWEVNKNELIIYQLFKYITRLMVCYPCFNDKLSGANEITDEKIIEQEDLAFIVNLNANKKPQDAEK
ncbi:hypothetical protein C1645_816841 [Glomus cerebriforme]|uniref:Uncharacterized protein n=1 Tax=Glomus cerebriforme TaxID=658196 RepID=A0A397TKE8_9GLOM|nr:hypothetical protein C1645_816841 [Glomus cerebriforme]